LNKDEVKQLLTEMFEELKVEAERRLKNNHYSPYPTDEDYWPAGILISEAMLKILTKEETD
jgi:hypothetical protein